MRELRAVDLMIEREEETLRTRVQQRLRDAIIDGFLPPGHKLIERELTEQTGVSRSIVREALAHLEARGLVERVAFKGFIVARIGPRTVREIYELRAALEGLAVELFTRNAKDSDLQVLREADEVLQRALKEGVMADIRKATTSYYDSILAGADNIELRKALEPYRDRIFMMRNRSISFPERRVASAREMRDLSDALLRRNSAGAVAISRAHVFAAMDAVLRRIAEEEAAQSVGESGT